MCALKLKVITLSGNFQLKPHFNLMNLPYCSSDDDGIVDGDSHPSHHPSMPVGRTKTVVLYTPVVASDQLLVATYPRVTLTYRSNQSLLPHSIPKSTNKPRVIDVPLTSVAQFEKDHSMESTAPTLTSMVTFVETITKTIASRTDAIHEQRGINATEA